MKASAAFCFLKAKRGAITMDGCDLPDQNKNIQRISQLNYLLEQRSNIIGRYCMLAFKYKLSRTGSGPGLKINAPR